MNSLKLFGEYLNERYDNQHLIEVEGGFAGYEIRDHDGKNAMHVHHLYISPENRGLSKDVANASKEKKIVTENHIPDNNSKTLELFLKIEDIARKNYCDIITCLCWVDSKNGNNILKLYLNIGFSVIGGEGPAIRLNRKVRHEK